MKKIYFPVLMSMLFITLRSQTFDWAKREGLWAYDYGYGVATDNAGNVYVAGKYELNADFSGNTVPCQGNHDIFLAQYSPGGNLNWVTTAGGPLGDYATSIACDDNYVYIAGEIEGVGSTIIFQNSTDTLTSVCFNDIFFAKYDFNGNLIWAKQEGWWHNEKALGIAVDNSGNIFICGFFNDTTYFSSNMVLGYGDNDIFVAKYDASGNFQWVRKAGSATRDEAKAIKCDAAGNVYICGMFEDNCVFGTQTFSNPGGYFDLFVAKYDANGNLQWVKTAGDTYDDVAWGLDIDNSGKIYIAGEFVGFVLFDGIPLITSGGNDVFVACYDAAGNVQWATPAGGGLTDRARALGCDGTNIYITGQFGASATFGSYFLTAADSSDVFIAALNNSGNFFWATAVGGVNDSIESLGYESGNAVCAEANGNVYATGAILDGGIFGSTSYNEFGRTDVFVCKITQMGVNVEAADNQQKFLIYPNPSKGVFTVSGINFPAELKIYNSLGRQMFSRKMELNEEKVNLNSGIYLLEILSPEKIYRYKVIIQ